MAELGFLGVRVMTWMQTPRRFGEVCKAGALDLFRDLPSDELINRRHWVKTFHTPNFPAKGNGSEVYSKPAKSFKQ